MDQTIPHNEGVLRAVDIRIPRGSFLNAEFPAATGYGNHLSDHIVPAVMRALEAVVPDRITADWAPVCGGILAHKNPETDALYVTLMIAPAKGGGGGTAGADGFDGIGIIASGGALGSVDPEMWEIQEPHFVRKIEYLPSSGGAGEWRGGLGIDSEIELLWPLEALSVLADGEDEMTGADGIRGGRAGSPNSLELEYPDGTRVQPRGKSMLFGVPAGTIWRQRSAGGGGFGDPLRRDRATIGAEIRAELLSPEAARDEYGFDDRQPLAGGPNADG